LEKTTDLIINSIKKKADLIITPENTSLFTLDHSELLEKAEEMNNNFFLKELIIKSVVFSNLEKKLLSDVS